MLDQEDLDREDDAGHEADHGAADGEQRFDHGSTPVRITRARRAARMPT